MKQNQKNLINLLTILILPAMFFSKILTGLLVLSIIFLLNKKEKVENKFEKIDNINSILLTNEKEKLKKQIELYELKTKILDEILITTFGKTSLTYRKFDGTIYNISKLFKENIENITLQMSLVDENKLIKYHATKDIKVINNLLKDNDVILDKLNKLIIELSEINDIDSETKAIIFTDELNDLNLIIKKYGKEI